MTRRSFLARLLAGAAGAALATTVDVEKLLWTPGERTHILPPPDGWTPPPHDEWTARRMIREYARTKDQYVTRMDILYGYAVLRPELCARIVSA